MMAENNLKMESESDGSFEDRIHAELSKPKKKKYVQIKKQGECVECKQQKKIEAKNMCKSCYNRSLKKLPGYNKPNCFCVGCQKMKKLCAKSMCVSCYNTKLIKAKREDVNKHKECAGCKQIKSIEAHGLCSMCYQQSKPKNKGKCQECGQVKILPFKNTCSACQSHKRAKTDIRMCKNCEEERPHVADQMCRQCYNKTRRENPKQHKECVKCKQLKPIEGHGMCSACYSKEYQQKLKADTSKHKKCSECKQTKLIRAREMCQPCYHKRFVRPRQMAKRNLVKRTTKAKKLDKAIPKLEPTSDNEERSVSPIDIIKEECKPEQIDNDNQQS